MKKRNFSSILLASLFAVLLCIPAAAGSVSASSSAVQAPTCVWGTLTRQEDGGLLLQNDSEGAPYPEIILHGESILFLDAVTGEEISQDTIRDGSTVYAYIGSAVNASLPPHATAHLILANLPEDFGAPQYVQISSVTPAAEGESTETAALTQVEFTTTSGITLTAAGETTLSRFRSEDAVRLEDLVPGTWLLVWSNSKGTPERVMVFDNTYRGYVACGKDGVVSVNGVPLSQRAKTAGDSLALLPVRAVSEALGLSVTWADRQASVSEGSATLLTVAPDAAGDICVLEDGTLYLDAGILARELNLFQAG